MANFKISIIIPAYNSEKTIERAINSVLTQNYHNKEIIVVNDGSFDSTKEILEKYKDSIIAVNTKNLGVCNARNTGIEKSSGDYILFVDSDDYLLPNCLGIMADNIDDSDILCCSFKIKKRSSNHNYCFIKSEMNQEQFIKGLCKIGSNRDYMYVWGKLFKKNILEKDIFPKDIKIGEDVFATIKATLKSKKIKTISDVVYVYDTKESTATKKIFNKDYFDLYNVWNLVRKEFEKTNSQYIRYADINIFRLDYTILTRLILSNNKTKKENIELIINATNRLKKNYKELLSSGIVISRKIMIVLVLAVSELYISLQTKNKLTA